MKIGILTYHSVYNFGANLQAFSTVEYLKNNGFQPIIINWVPLDLEARYNHTISAEQAAVHKKFINDNLPCSEICRTDDDIIRVIENQNLKGIIIGSDAVLQHQTLFSRVHIGRKGITIDSKPGTDILFPNPFWGSFIPNLKEKIPVVIMSASSQNANFKSFKWNLRRKMGFSLSQFKSVSVRDSWTGNMIKYLTHNRINPAVTPDPVFAYNQNIKEQCSKEYLLDKFNLSDRYLLLSFRNQSVVSKEWLKSFQTIAKKDNYQCVALTTPGGISWEIPFQKIDTPLSPQEWYGLIKYSSGFIGEQMHPIVIALHNVVPFYSFDYYGFVRFRYFANEKSSKIYDLLYQADLLKNRVHMIGKGKKCPSAEEVFLQIKNFDFKKCNLFSSNQLDRYNKMMNDILSVFSH